MPPDEFHFLCESEQQFEECCELIRDNELELVAVIAIARPTEAALPTEQLLLIFGDAVGLPIRLDGASGDAAA